MQALEVWSTVLFELLLHGFEVGETISDDGTALIVETLLPVQKIDNTAADHRIERHEGAFNLCRDPRPAGLLMRFPQFNDRLAVH